MDLDDRLRLAHLAMVVLLSARGAGVVIKGRLLADRRVLAAHAQTVRRRFNIVSLQILASEHRFLVRYSSNWIE